MSWREDLIVIPIFEVVRKKEPSLVFDYPAKMVPTVLKSLMIAKSILIDVTPHIVIKIIANRVKQFARRHHLEDRQDQKLDP